VNIWNEAGKTYDSISRKPTYVQFIYEVLFIYTSMLVITNMERMRMSEFVYEKFSVQKTYNNNISAINFL
jgi:hypothetical protein